MLSKLCWYFWQVFPCTYRTCYGEGCLIHFAVWKMWLGHCYQIDDIIVDTSCHALDDLLQMIECARREAGCRESCCR